MLVHALHDKECRTPLQKILPWDSVLHKDQMDVDCVLHLSKENVLSYLESIDHVVHSIVPESLN